MILSTNFKRWDKFTALGHITWLQKESLNPVLRQSDPWWASAIVLANSDPWLLRTTTPEQTFLLVFKFKNVNYYKTWTRISMGRSQCWAGSWDTVHIYRNKMVNFTFSLSLCFTLSHTISKHIYCFWTVFFLISRPTCRGPQYPGVGIFDPPVVLVGGKEHEISQLAVDLLTVHMKTVSLSMKNICLNFTPQIYAKYLFNSRT